MPSLKFWGTLNPMHPDINLVQTLYYTFMYPPIIPWKEHEIASITQRVHVGIWYILRAQRGSHIPTFRPKYILYTYIDPLGQPRLSSQKETVPPAPAPEARQFAAGHLWAFPGFFGTLGTLSEGRSTQRIGLWVQKLRF